MSDSIHFAVFTGASRCGAALANVSVYLASGMSLQGHIVDLITLNIPKAELTRFYRHVSGISRLNVYNLRVKHTRMTIAALVQYYRSRRPDVMFSQLTYINAAAIIARILSLTRPINILLEGTIISKVGSIDSKRDPKLRLVPWLVKLLYPYADGLVAKGHDVLTDLQAVVGDRLKAVKTKILPNPYDIARFRLLAQEPIEHPWLLGQTYPVIISSGRLWEQKGFDVLIKAFAEVRRETSCRLIILGEGPERGQLEALIKELKLTSAVDLPGWVPNPWQYLSRSSVFVLPSRWEGWPSALVEAIACGLPAITTNCPGAGKEIIAHGETGLTVPTDDVQTLKNAILTLLRDPPLGARLAERAARTVQSYDYKTVTHDYVIFARSLLATS